MRGRAKKTDPKIVTIETEPCKRPFVKVILGLDCGHTECDTVYEAKFRLGQYKSLKVGLPRACWACKKLQWDGDAEQETPSVDAAGPPRLRASDKTEYLYTWSEGDCEDSKGWTAWTITDKTKRFIHVAAFSGRYRLDREPLEQEGKVFGGSRGIRHIFYPSPYHDQDRVMIAGRSGAPTNLHPHSAVIAKARCHPATARTHAMPQPIFGRSVP